MTKDLAFFFQDVCGAAVSPDGRFVVMVVAGKEEQDLRRIAFPVEALSAIEQTIKRLKAVRAKPCPSKLIN